MKLDELGEFGWIGRQSTRLALRDGVRLGIGDDGAVLASLRTPIVTTDALIEGVHFRRDWTSPRALGCKAMAVNVSDLAAMGALPIAAFVNLALSTRLLQSDEATNWLDELYAGFEDAARDYKFTVAGGDTTRSSHEISLGVMLIGDAIFEGYALKCGASTPLTRSGAKVGDVVIATGTLGDSAAGLWLLQQPALAAQLESENSVQEYLRQRHLEPRARLNEIRAALNIEPLANRAIVSAAIDLSDGLAGDAGHVAHRSNVTLEIEAALLPISHPCRITAQRAREIGENVSALDWALHGGEDYELLLCVPPENVDAICAAIVNKTSTPATVIGRCLPPQHDASVVLVDTNGARKSTRGAWQHF